MNTAINWWDSHISTQRWVIGHMTSTHGGIATRHHLDLPTISDLRYVSVHNHSLLPVGVEVLGLWQDNTATANSWKALHYRIITIHATHKTLLWSNMVIYWEVLSNLSPSLIKRFLKLTKIFKVLLDLVVLKSILNILVGHLKLTTCTADDLVCHINTVG